MPSSTMLIPLLELDGYGPTVWLQSCISELFIDADAAGFKLFDGNNMRFHEGKRYTEEWNKFDIQLILKQRMCKQKFWTHRTVWGVRELPEDEYAFRMLTGKHRVQILNFVVYKEIIEMDFNKKLTPLGQELPPADRTFEISTKIGEAVSRRMEREYRERISEAQQVSAMPF